MIVYYAVGGGLGHLVRARAFLFTTEITGEVVVLSSSDDKIARKILADHQIVKIPDELNGRREALRRWLIDWLTGLKPDTLIIDAFPAGILGEFSGLSFEKDLELQHVARLLKWDRYYPVTDGHLPHFSKIWVVEPLASEQSVFLQRYAEETTKLSLQDPPESPDESGPEALALFLASDRPLWLIVHSQPHEEIEELLGYAQEQALAEEASPHLILACPSPPPDLPSSIHHLDIYPASSLFPLVDRIISACGFNLMRQTEAFADKHRFIPMLRRFDDQYLRAARRRLHRQKIEASLSTGCDPSLTARPGTTWCFPTNPCTGNTRRTSP